VQVHPLDEDEKYRLIDSQTDGANDEDRNDFMMSLEARTTFEYMRDAEKIVHCGRDRKRNATCQEKIHVHADGEDVKQYPIHQRRGTANEKIPDDSHQRRLYFRMQ
jgi:hypothetical protein